MMMLLLAHRLRVSSANHYRLGILAPFADLGVPYQPGRRWRLG